MPQERFKSPARVSKEQFRNRRSHLLKSAQAIMEDAAIYMVIRRSDVYYVYNSEASEIWLPTKGDEVCSLSLGANIADDLPGQTVLSEAFTCQTKCWKKWV